MHWCISMFKAPARTIFGGLMIEWFWPHNIHRQTCNCRKHERCEVYCSFSPWRNDTEVYEEETAGDDSWKEEKRQEIGKGSSGIVEIKTQNESICADTSTDLAGHLAMSEEEYLEFKCAPDIRARTASNGTKGCLFSQELQCWNVCAL